ncbi:hypothetical protein ACFL0L_02850 [Patescibacteria group bacterium]
MPETSVFIVNAAKELLENIEWPTQVLPSDQVATKIRNVIKLRAIRFEIVRAAIAVWLFQKFTNSEPTVITIISILADPDLLGDQRNAMSRLSELLGKKIVGPVYGDDSKVRIRTHIRKAIGDA